jgi:hypothetical protein
MEVRTTPSGWHLEFDRPAQPRAIRVMDREQQLLQRVLLAGNRNGFDVSFPWEPDSVYLLDVQLPDTTLLREIRTPTAPDPIVATLEVPFGHERFRLGSASDAVALLPRGQRFTMGVLIENQGDLPRDYELRLKASAGLQLSSEDPRVRLQKLEPDEGGPPDDDSQTSSAAVAQSSATWQGQLKLELDDDLVLLELEIAPGVQQARLWAELHTGGTQPTSDSDDDAPDATSAELPDVQNEARNEVLPEDRPRGQNDLQNEARPAAAMPIRRTEIILRTIDASQLAQQLVAGEVAFPADAQGARQGERLADTVMLPNPVWSWIRKAFRPRGSVFNYYAAYAHQALPLTNRGDAPLNLVIESDVVLRGTDEPLKEFAPPDWLAPRSVATSEHLIRVPAGETAVARLPLFVRPSLEPGSYQRRLRVYAVGSHEPVLQIVQPLEVVRGNAFVSLVTVVCLTMAVVAWGLVLLRGRHWLKQLGTHALVVIALISGLHFLVSYTARIAGDILAGVSGPFYLFIAGIGSEGLTTALMAALIVLLPRVGTFAASSLTVFLLNAMFSGQLGLADLLFITVSIVLGETLLALFGVTTTSAVSRPAERPRVGIVLRVALALGLANGATLTAQYCLIQVLYRLFFATWYIGAVALITGLLYGAIGAAYGVRLGYQLRRTAA